MMDEQSAQLTLRAGDQVYGLAVENVVEVAAMVALDPVPEAPPAVLGVANRHGAAVPIIDLRRVFDHPETPINSASLFVVVVYNNVMVGLVADEVLQVQYLTPSATPVTAAGRYIKDIVGHNARLIQIIDLGALISAQLPDNFVLEGDSTTTS